MLEDTIFIQDALITGENANFIRSNTKLVYNAQIIPSSLRLLENYSSKEFELFLF